MAEQNFDVFLAHSSRDKPLIRQMYHSLKKRGLRPWLDEEEIAPGTSFQDEIQQAIAQIKTAAICIGQGGLGKWQALELKSFITQCVEKDIPVIPVLLPGVKVIPESLPFLREFHAVTFGQDMEDERALYGLEWGITGQKPQKRQSEPANPQPPIATDDLSSERFGATYYTQLRDLLKAQDWKAADQETAHRMCEVMGRQKEGWLRVEDLQKFPCQDLQTIDRLWVKYSNGHFGFSVQKKIWQECGSPTSSGKDWDRFCVKVGWQNTAATAYLNYSDLKFDPSLSPTGELPLDGGLERVWVGFFWKVMEFSSLAQRLVDCNR
jgi:GUN4-like/TIR domain